MIELDPFIVNHSLETLRKNNSLLRGDLEAYIAKNNSAMEAVNEQIKEMNEKDIATASTINGLTFIIDGMARTMEALNTEIVQTKLNNIKQEMITRTLLNLQQYRAHDMFVDTFTTADNIDYGKSIRAEWFEDTRAIGRTTASTVYANQPSQKTNILITANAGDDNGLCQTFVLDKNQMIDKVSIYLEKHNESVWKPIVVKITSDLEGNDILASGSLEPSEINEAGFYEFAVNNVMLAKYTDYYITVLTADTYGYRIGVDMTGDTYFAGTSYILYNNVWTDNNFDISFKVWCFAAEDENNATIITKEFEIEGEPISIVFDAESSTYSGSLNYYVTIDDGANWKILEPGQETFLNDLAVGNKLRIKAYIDGNSRIDAWGFVLKRGEGK